MKSKTLLVIAFALGVGFAGGYTFKTYEINSKTIKESNQLEQTAETYSIKKYV